jgi:polyhydroxyalkanoate synthesis regulator protein
MGDNDEKKPDVQTIYRLGKEILAKLASLRPEKSFSFVLNEDGHEAIRALIELTEEKMPKNMNRLLESAMATFIPLSEFEPGTPLNVNLNEDDIKAMEKVLELAERNWERPAEV